MNVSGYVFSKDRQPIANVQITFTNPTRTITTDKNGFYNMVLDYHWTGSVNPQKQALAFSRKHMIITKYLPAGHI
ncbi:MAG: hypothetical protein OMM_13599 [Candidatus Magnetoglobus multicellularis str. Araruama]|uniref:Carboxypeptidase regulatory-like domain-containing protein n=1 Tax=Candidatus Magnetoglobus multicellularis str. Araruama TaxID=890399 RepID=A0A1V1NTQ3_9BACT|nr:MAG: hypothetical protein OMM_13599 [Candidatus Magnetoglobus multicellularis str. Araruama]